MFRRRQTRSVPRARIIRIFIMAAAALLIVSGLLFGCTSVVTPPSNPKDPVAVYFVREAMHKGLVFAREDGGFVEYGFGDWDWYALNCDRWYHVFDTVLWPTQGALGRRSVPAPTPPSLKRFYGAIETNKIIVARADAASLLRELDDQFDRAFETRHHNTRYAMDFVEHGCSFWFLYNCNDVAADWLRKLGCSVSFVPIRLGLSVKEAE